MTKAKPDAAFEVRFVAPGITPWAIPIGRVAEALSAIKRLAIGEAGADAEDDSDDESADEAIRLLDVKKGSALFRFTGKSPDTTIKRFRQTGTVLENPEKIGANEYILRPVRELSSIAKSLGCSIVIKEPGQDGASLATIVDNSFDILSRSVLLKGDTKIYGRVQRVGGATEMRCGLRVSFQDRMLFCKVSSVEVARQLGDLLYQNAVCSGSAEWFKGSMSIFSFVIHEVTQPKGTSILASLNNLWKDGLNEWDTFSDPDAVLDEVRGQ
jgi:hypothetical protein